jgi:hypothetical protein
VKNDEIDNGLDVDQTEWNRNLLWDYLKKNCLGIKIYILLLKNCELKLIF